MHAFRRLIAPLLALAASAAHAGDTPATPDMRERLGACAVCHGEHGEGREGSGYMPHLAGKPAGYLLAQLQAFRDGHRVYPQMTWLMRNLDDDYLRATADYYAALPPHSTAQRVSMSAEGAARARELVEHGDPSRDVPACAACHGADLAGQQPGVPALIGLPADYVIAQLGAWKTGVRKAPAPDCMAEVARALDPADMRRIGEWLASQDHSAALVPAPQGSFELPVRCGTQPDATVATEATP